MQSCEYAEIGFLSRRMRDEHLDVGHQESKSQADLLPDDLELDEIQPLFFDLIRLDKVEDVKRIFHHFGKLKEDVQSQLSDLVASSGSAAMAQVVCQNPSNSSQLILSINSTNFETFQWILTHIDHPMHINEMGEVLTALLKSTSLVMFQECEKYIIKTFTVPTNYGFSDTLNDGWIRATGINPDSEKCLLSLWSKLQMSGFSWFYNRDRLGNALRVVAKSTCSLALAKKLLEYGAEVDFVKRRNALTPLRLAARGGFPEAAELIKLLLYQGANPEHMLTFWDRKISEEKGAKKIAKWLSMSWDELVQKIKEDRKNGICPPEYA